MPAEGDFSRLLETARVLAGYGYWERLDLDHPLRTAAIRRFAAVSDLDPEDLLQLTNFLREQRDANQTGTGGSGVEGDDAG